MLPSDQSTATPAPPNVPLAKPNDMAVMWAADDAGLSQSTYRLFGRIYRRYNHKRGCDESIPNMADACRMHPDTARSCLKELEALGMIVQTARPGFSKRIDVTDPATWAVNNPPETKGGVPPGSEAPPSDTQGKEGEGYPPETKGGDPPETKGDEVDTQADTRSEPSTPTVPKGTGGGGRSRFPDFWEAYPVKRKKKSAEEKWKAKKLDRMADDLIADVKTRMERDDQWKRGFIPHPTTYLNGELWNDELTGPTRTAPAADDARNRPVENYNRAGNAALAALRSGS